MRVSRYEYAVSLPASSTYVKHVRCGNCRTVLSNAPIIAAGFLPFGCRLPDVRSYGNLGNWVKSGARFSLNASRPLLRLVGGVVQKRGVAGELLDTRKPVRRRVERRLHEAQRRGAELQHLLRPAHALRFQILEGNHFVDQAISSASAAVYWRQRYQISRAFFWPTMFAR